MISQSSQAVFSGKHPKGPIAWMAGHSVASNLLMLVFLLGGFFMAGQIRQEVFPEFDLDRVSIGVAYPGSSPEEVERAIVMAVEEALTGLSGIKEITSSANEGSARITVEILDGEDVESMARDIQGELDRVTSFPEEVETPRVTVAKRKRYVVELALFGSQSERVLRELAEDIRDRLLQDPEITQVEFSGIRDYEISVEIPENTLRTYGLSLDEVASRIRQASMDTPGGSIRAASGDILIRMNERRTVSREFGDIPIVTDAAGAEVLLSEIAVIRDGFEETDHYAVFNGHPAVMISVYRTGDQSPTSVSKAVKAKMGDIRAALPPGVDLVARNDRSNIFDQRLNLLLRNGYIGLGLVFILLALFLEARLAFWVSLGIPISFLGSLLFLNAVGSSINMVTMFAFIVSLGIVVDDAIVVGENVYFQRQKGISWREAAINGAREIALPVTFSVLTNIVAFMPLFFVPGFMGKVFRGIPIVVISVFAISLIESLYILPAHLGHRKKIPVLGMLRWQERFSRWITRVIRNVYGTLLLQALRARYLTISIGVAVLILTFGYIKSGRLGFELFPKVESDYARVTALLPYGSAVEKTDDIQNLLVKSAKQIMAQNGGETLVNGIYSRINNNEARVTVYLTPPKMRPISTAEFTRLWQAETGTLAGLETLRFESDAGGPGSGRAVSVELRHRDMDVLKQASRELAIALEAFPKVTDIDDGFAPGKRQIDFQMTPEGRSAGLTAQGVARRIRNAYYGARALRLLRGRNEVTVTVRRPKSERVSEYHLEEMILNTPSGREIPLREAVTLNRGRAYTSIQHRNGQRVITVKADVRPRSRAGLVVAALKKDTLPGLTERYVGLDYSFEGRQARQRESMQALGKGLLIALGVIYAMLAIPFNSIIQPFIIIASVPFGIVGAVIGHIIMGYSLSVISMFGVVALSGVVINDSLILIDLANRKIRREGLTVFSAIHESGIQRFRPILLTTLTTFGGLTPIILETSRQARFLIPMAISLGFGILFATLICLLLVPALFLVVEDIRRLMPGFTESNHDVVPTYGAES